MKVFVAGGSGVIGRQLLPKLVAAGHQVTATTSKPENREKLRSLGATPAVLDALDEGAVMAAVREAVPDVVMNQLTHLPQRYDLRHIKPWFEQTARLRADGTRNLLAAARAVGARRFVYQSIAFMYKLTGPEVLDEEAPVAVDAAEPFGTAVRGTVEGERLTLGTVGVEGVVLRYGALYGPGTYVAPDGDFARQARQRMLAIVGGGRGVYSFVHVEDAAAAAVVATSRGSGVFNIVDDTPVAARVWIPVFARAVGAPRQLSLPRWAARLMAGGWAVESLTEGRGASNARARAELGWRPRYPSCLDQWRGWEAQASRKTLPV